MTPLIYVAGPYRAPSRWHVEQNIRAAEDVGALIAQAGAYPVIPHANTRGYFEGLAPDELWLAGTLRLLKACDGAVFIRGWGRSTGATEEHSAAIHLGMPVVDLEGVRLGEAARLRFFLDDHWPDRDRWPS